MPHTLVAHVAAAPASLPTYAPRKRAAGLLLAALIHVLIILALLLHRAPPKPAGTPGNVVIINLPPLAPEEAPPAAKPPPSPPKASPAPRPPRTAPVPKPRTAPPPEIVVPPPEVPPPPEPPPPVSAEPPMDMQSYIRQKRREAAEQAAPSAPAAPSENDIAMANINRNLQSITGGRPGASGVFEILHKGQREARFAFNGWTPGIGGNWREVVDVDAGLGGNVELAIIRKMIEMIRGHYKGDFNWQSHRLNRVIVMSARPQDNAELEAFLMQEFFGARR
ncbi:MAG: hypothetical protein ACRCV9_09120 [Burkholderiaceae bacterium]